MTLEEPSIGWKETALNRLHRVREIFLLLKNLGIDTYWMKWIEEGGKKLVDELASNSVKDLIVERYDNKDLLWIISKRGIVGLEYQLSETARADYAKLAEETSKKSGALYIDGLTGMCFEDNSVHTAFARFFTKMSSSGKRSVFFVVDRPTRIGAGLALLRIAPENAQDIVGDKRFPTQVRREARQIVMKNQNAQPARA